MFRLDRQKAKPLTKRGRAFTLAFHSDHMNYDPFYWADAAHYQNGGYSTPENLGPVVNNRYSVGDVFVAPDESYLITTVWGDPESSGESDLYISHRDKDGNWGKAINIGAPINSPDNEGCPTVSPDGEFLFLFRVNLDAVFFQAGCDGTFAGVFVDHDFALATDQGRVDAFVGTGIFEHPVGMHT